MKPISKLAQVKKNLTSQLVTYSVTCERCGAKEKLYYRQEDYEMWASGKLLIQDALSYISDSDREMLLSATCNKCWEKLFVISESDEQ